MADCRDSMKVEYEFDHVDFLLPFYFVRNFRILSSGTKRSFLFSVWKNGIIILYQMISVGHKCIQCNALGGTDLFVPWSFFK